MTAKRLTPDELIKAERKKAEKEHATALATLLNDPEQAEARQAKALVPRPYELTSSIVPRGTSFHRWISGYLLTH